MLKSQFQKIKYVTVANVEDIDDKLMVAKIPVGNIKEVYFQIEKFNLGIIAGGHLQLRIIFNEPVLLRSQFPQDALSPISSTNELILTVNAARPEGIPWEPGSRGLNDAYAATWGVVTVRERYLDSYLRQRNTTEQWKLQLTAEQAKKVLLSYLAWSETFEYRRVYNTIAQSCATEQFFNLDSAIGQDTGFSFPKTIVPFKMEASSTELFHYKGLEWDPPKFFEISPSVKEALTKVLRQGPTDAVADLFPLHAVNGMMGASGPLRDRKLVADGNLSLRPDFHEDPSLIPVHTELCKMAATRKQQGTDKPTDTWKNAADTCSKTVTKGSNTSSTK